MKQADHVNTIKEMLKEFLPFTKERFGYDSYPSINFAKDTKNAADPLGKTAYYEPESKKITVYVVGRHPKDIMRSISHELVHHAQNIRGEFSQLKSFGEGYAQNDEHLREMEREAYEQGNLCFRDWEDQLKKKNKPIAGVREKDMFNERRQKLNSALMERFGYSSKKSRIDEMMDEEGDQSIPGMEGPFTYRSGAVLYYDPKEGKYYDRSKDMYLSHEEALELTDTSGPSFTESIKNKDLRNQARDMASEQGYLELVKKITDYMFVSNQKLAKAIEKLKSDPDKKAEIQLLSLIMKQMGISSADLATIFTKTKSNINSMDKETEMNENSYLLKKKRK